MAFKNITSNSIIGDVNSGVQGMFPRFTFDANSRPSLTQITEYANTAIANVTRLVRFKGYDPVDIVADEDLVFVANWIKLTVAAEIHTVLDQFKDNKAANIRLQQLESINRQFEEAEDPFPGVERAASGQAAENYPTRVVRVHSSDL